MARKHSPYAPEFRRQMIELVRAGRTPEELAKEFEPSAQAIRNWIAQADLDEGRREDGLMTAEREELGRLRRENRQLKLEREILSKAAAWFARETDVIPPRDSNSWSENRARYPIAVMCRVLGVSSSGYYAWVKRPASARAVMDDALIAEIRAAHAASKGTYGAPRLQIDLADIGIRISRKRIARLMRHAGLAGVSRRKSTVTTVRDGARQALDLVDRNFTADRPDMLWVADITYIPTWAGFLYLAVVLDAFSRRIVGWSMSITLHTQVVLDALDMALWQRRPSGVIHHSDQGS